MKGMSAAELVEKLARENERLKIRIEQLESENKSLKDEIEKLTESK